MSTHEEWLADVAAAEHDRDIEVAESLVNLRAALDAIGRNVEVIHREHARMTRLYWVEVVEGAPARVQPPALSQIEVGLAALRHAYAAALADLPALGVTA